MHKITIVGAGNVGATAALRIAEKQLAREIVMLDIIDGLPQGKGLDMWESSPLSCFNAKVTGGTDFSLMEGSGIVVVTSGVPRKPGMSRTDLLAINARIVKDVCGHVKAYAPDSTVIMVTNPLDSMTYLAHRLLGWPRERVFGMAGVLDSSRFRTFISEALDVAVQDVHALVMGAHGDDMVPLPRYTTVAGIPIERLMPRERLDELIARTRNGGGEIVDLLKTGSAFYAPGASIAEMAMAVALDVHIIRPCSTLLNGEYGISDVCVGVPVKLGREGIREVIELPLANDELEALNRSAEKARESNVEIGKAGFFA
jgi:malate dehydrogenase